LTEPASDRREAEHAAQGTRRKEYPELVIGRGSLRDYALRRLKASRLLQASAVVAVLCYGALPFLVIFPDPVEPRLQFWAAAVVVLLSLASWSLLFWWYPVLERTQKVLGDDTRGRTIARTLESLAIGSVVVVHALMAFIIVRAGVAS
jgi:hypothetical protein